MLDDLRKTIEATIGELTPARAKSLAKSLAGAGAAKDQVAKSAGDLIEWSQKNRERLRDFVRREVSSQMGAVGVATQAELDSLKKRVRALERAAEKQVPASPKPAGKRTGGEAKAGTAKIATSSPRKKPTRASAKGRTAKGRTAAKGTVGGTRARG